MTRASLLARFGQAGAASQGIVTADDHSVFFDGSSFHQAYAAPLGTLDEISYDLDQR